MTRRLPSLITWFVGLLLVAGAGRAYALFGTHIQRWDEDVSWTVLLMHWNWPPLTAASLVDGMLMVAVPGVCFYLVLESHSQRFKLIRWIVELPIASLWAVGMVLWARVFIFGFRLTGEVVSEGLLPLYGYSVCYVAVLLRRLHALRRSRAQLGS